MEDVIVVRIKSKENWLKMNQKKLMFTWVTNLKPG